VQGGTAGNILARECVFQFDLRAPGMDVKRALDPFFALATQLDAEIKARAPEGGVAITQLADVPPLSPDPDSPAEAFVRRLAGDNGPARGASFGAEAGQFQRAGLPAVLCGPGSVDQAHQPDEFVERSQMERGAALMARLAEALSG
jgi:acetylornithine deacetylase